MSDMENIVVIIDMAVQLLDVYYFVKDDWSVGSLVIEIFTKFVVAVMKGIERQEVSNCYPLVYIVFG